MSEVKSKAKTQQDQIKNRILAYQGTFSSNAGKVVLEDLKKATRYGENIYGRGMTEMDLAYAAGRQSVLNDLIHILNQEVKK